MVEAEFPPEVVAVFHVLVAEADQPAEVVPPAEADHGAEVLPADPDQRAEVAQPAEAVQPLEADNQVIIFNWEKNCATFLGNRGFMDPNPQS